MIENYRTKEMRHRTYRIAKAVHKCGYNVHVDSGEYVDIFVNNTKGFQVDGNPLCMAIPSIYSSTAPAGSCTIYQGSIGGTLRSDFFKSQWHRWTPSQWFEDTAINCEYFYEALGPYLFNRNYFLLSMKEVDRRADELLAMMGGQFFIRPTSQGKSFDGQVVKNKFQIHALLCQYQCYQNNNLAAVIAPVKKIKQEWRFFIDAEDQRIITSSRSYVYGKQKPKHGAPEQVTKFVEQILTENYKPKLAYVLDIAEEHETGRLGLLELNGFNAAGWFDVDHHKLIHTVSGLAYQYWLDDGGEENLTDVNEFRTGWRYLKTVKSDRAKVPSNLFEALRFSACVDSLENRTWTVEYDSKEISYKIVGDVTEEIAKPVVAFAQKLDK